jgi:mono/diheme cytochrome c family protein
MNSEGQMKNTNRRAWLVRALCTPLLLLGLTACHLEMYDQPKSTYLGQSDFFQDQSAMRPVVPNTVARGQVRVDEAATGRVGGLESGAYVETNPIPVTPELLARGAERYTIYCAVCHGAAGDGKGSGVYQLFRPRARSFYDADLVAEPDGYYYSVIVDGKGGMYSYASRIQNIEDRWAIIAHIRELQQNPPEEPQASAQP